MWLLSHVIVRQPGYVKLHYVMIFSEKQMLLYESRCPKMMHWHLQKVHQGNISFEHIEGMAQQSAEQVLENSNNDLI